MAITTSGLYNLSLGKIRQIAIPPLAEQARIITRVAAAQTQSRLAEALVDSPG